MLPEHKDRLIAGVHHVGTFEVTLDLATSKGPAWAVPGLHPKRGALVTGLVARLGRG